MVCNREKLVPALRRSPYRLALDDFPWQLNKPEPRKGLKLGKTQPMNEFVLGAGIHDPIGESMSKDGTLMQKPIMIIHIR